MLQEQNRIAASSSKIINGYQRRTGLQFNGGTQSPHAAFATNELKNSKLTNQ